MFRRFTPFLGLVVLSSVAAASRVDAVTKAPAAPPGYHLVKKLPVGGEGGWDYLTVDSAARRLYVSRSTRVLVFDADTGAPVGEIPNTAGVHGVALVPGIDRGFTSNGKSSSVTVFGISDRKSVV